ncbi:MAG TPA: polysaccharide deacetylase family protein [Lunatimonas sp.]|nr:polysaccharide deacetylase family protein [Lunatimonas sp.]
MKKKRFVSFLAVFAWAVTVSNLFAQNPEFPWPEGKKMAISLSFDDARLSNPELGIPLLNEYGVKATFFVVPSNMQRNLEGWKKAVASGHEMANHSIQHPCSGNFVWSRNRALEDYTIGRMRNELSQANAEIQSLLGVSPQVYAYPCGLTFVGKGEYTQSFVPLISDMFLAGRGWLDEAPVDPFYADMAQLTGMKMDNMEFEEILPIINSASDNGQWLVLAGHETNESGNQTTYLRMLRELCAYANDPKNGIWIAPIGTVAAYVKEKRELMAGNVNIPGIVRPTKDGTLNLTAETGKGIGPDIKYMPDWNAFGWFTGKDRVEWDLALEKGGNYEVWMEWSVSDEESGKEFILMSGDQEITGKVAKSGSWETFKKVKIGELNLKEDYNHVLFKAVEDFDKGALMDIKSFTLVRLSN